MNIPGPFGLGSIMLDTWRPLDQSLQIIFTKPKIPWCYLLQGVKRRWKCVIALREKPPRRLHLDFCITRPCLKFKMAYLIRHVDRAGVPNLVTFGKCKFSNRFFTVCFLHTQRLSDESMAQIGWWDKCAQAICSESESWSKSRWNMDAWRNFIHYIIYPCFLWNKMTMMKRGDKPS